MSSRAVDILRYLRPRYLFIRGDCLQPLLNACEVEHVAPGRYVEALVVTYNDGAAHSPRTDIGRRIEGLPVYHMPRCDLAFFLAVECPECHMLHSWPDLYRVEAMDPESLQTLGQGQPGRLALTSHFAAAYAPARVLSQLEGRMAPAGCPRGPGDVRLCA